MYLRQEISPKEKSLTHLNDEKVVSKHGSTEINSIIAEKESIFSQILSSEIDVSDRKILIKRVFEHSLEDGLKLAEKSQYTSKDYLETISSSKFFLKHNDFLNHLISEGEKKVNSESDKIALQTLKKSLSDHENILKSNANTLLLKGNEKLSSITSINLKTYLDDWYSQFISLKSVDTVSEYDPRSKGERMSEECLQYVLPSLKKMYHANGILTLVIKKINENNHEKLKPILQTIFDQDDYYRYRCSQSFKKFFDSVIKGKLNLNKYFDQFIENIFSKEEVARIIGSNKITAKQAEIIANTFELKDSQVKNERIVATNEVFKVSAKLAGENLLKDLNLAGVQIIWNEAKQEYEPFIENKESESKFLTEAKILDELEKMINDGVHKDFIVQGLVGLDSDRAWKIRDDCIKENTDKIWIARGLAGLDSDRAWKMRDDFIKAGVDKTWIAQSLAGLDSDRAWKMRDDFVKDGVDKSWIARGLAGDHTSFVWQFKQERQGISEEVQNKIKLLNLINTLEPVKVEQPIIENKESESKYLTEAKILDELEKMINDGVDKGNIVRRLVGLDSERAWKMRDDYIKAGGYEGWITASLAGLDSERAWKIRDDIIKAGSDGICISQSLAGLDSERAWKMRDDLIKAGVFKGYIAMSLYGLDSERAWKMRDDFIKHSKGYTLLSIAGLDSERAWKMRDDFIKDGVKDGVARTLAGLDSERAWKMRDDFIKDGVNMLDIAEGLAGNNKSFVWQLKQKQQSISEEVQNVIESSINDIDNLELAERIEDYLTNHSKISELRNLSVMQELKRFVSSSKQAVKNINSLIKATPELFIETIKAKNESTRIKNQLMYKVFPSTRPKAKQSWRNFYDYFIFNLNTNSELDARPEDYLNPDRMESLVGGDPEAKEGLEKEVMIFREPVSGLVVTKICSKLVGNNWDSSYQFPLAKLSMERAKENTVTLPKVSDSVVLPKLLNSDVIPERIKGVKNGQEILLEAEFTPFNEAIVRNVKKANSIVYSLQIDELPKAMNKISLAEYNKFKERFVSTHDAEMTKKIASLPEEIKLFLNSINEQEPAAQVQLIEQFVREIIYYDMKNAEVIPLKINKSLDERLEIMETRIDELISVSEANKEVLLGKKYAGVCADFASLTAAILREAGFLSGVLTGFSAQGRSVTINQAHATAFVVWPDVENGNQIFSVDGTPDGISGVSLPSLQQQEKIREDKIEEITTKSDEELEEITKILTSMDERMIRDLTNGQLESVLNNVLRYDVNIEVLQAVTSLLEVYSFSPMHKFDLENLDDKIKIIKFIKTELERARQEKLKSQVSDPGSVLFKAVEKFIKRFADDNNSKQGIEIIDQLLNLVGDILNPIERKALTAVVAYLKAKEMLGGNKQ